MPEDLKKMAQSDRRLRKARRGREEKARRDRVKRYKEKAKVEKAKMKALLPEPAPKPPNPIKSFFNRD